MLMLLHGIGTTSNVCGQLVFESDTTTIDITVVNLEDTLPFFGKFVGVTWLGDTTVTLNWKRINTECQEDWGFVVGDMNITLPPGNSSESVLPLVMDPTTSFELLVEVVHERIPGCCMVSIEFSEDGGEAIDTCHFVFRINSDCSATTSIDTEGEASEIFVYPNPVVGAMHIGGVDNLIAGYILDSSGRVVRRTNALRTDLGDLGPGLYYLMLRSAEGKYYLTSFIKT